MSDQGTSVLFKSNLLYFRLAFWFSSLQEQEGATLLVSAKFDVVSVRNIYLQFEEVSFLSFTKQ